MSLSTINASDPSPLVVAPLLESFLAVRALTEELAAPLSAEDQTVQSMADVSPTKWHRAHTTWFFETFVLAEYLVDYELYNETFGYLFNSYYEVVVPRQSRPERGLISRPGKAEVGRCRTYVDGQMAHPLTQAVPSDLADLVELGLQHEKQHQELLLMDTKHVLYQNPTRPRYRDREHVPTLTPANLKWAGVAGGIVSVGREETDTGFAFDNDFPRHEEVDGNLLDRESLHPRPTLNSEVVQQLFGDVWERTRSAYLPYPRFAAADGAVGEYNGKFMINQNVLKGGSALSPADHLRATYRNFFPAASR